MMGTAFVVEQNHQLVRHGVSFRKGLVKKRSKIDNK